LYTIGRSWIRRAAASATTRWVPPKLGTFPSTGWALAHEKAVRTDSTLERAMRSHCSACTEAGATVAATCHITP
jgi:hypothetical protein